MDCEQTRALFSEYIDSAMDSERAKMVENHMAGCENCRYEYISLKKVLAALNGLETKTAPSDFLLRVKARIKRESFTDKLKNILSSIVNYRIPMEITAFVATACLVFVLLLSITIQKKNYNTASGPEEVKTAENSEANILLRGKGPINLELLLADRNEKPIHASDLVPVSSGASSGADRMGGVLPGRIIESNNKKAGFPALDVEMIIFDVKGRIISKEHTRGIPHPEYITMEIPAEGYADFLERMEAVGSFSSSPPVLSKEYSGPVALRVHLIKKSYKE